MLDHDERQTIYKQLEDKNGKAHQLAVAIEEMAELTKELSKLLRADSYTNSKKVCEEIADVKICIEQLQRFFDKEDKIISWMIEYKLQRLCLFYLSSTGVDDELILVPVVNE